MQGFNQSRVTCPGCGHEEVVWKSITRTFLQPVAGWGKFPDPEPELTMQYPCPICATPMPWGDDHAG